jgi:ATP-dependent Clp protease ATP-binding subunit ClpA
LSFETTERVVDKFIGELRAQLADKKVSIELTEEARAWLARRGYDRLYGARPMARLIQTTIKQPLAEQLLFGEAPAGSKVLIDEKEENLTIEFTK